MVTLRVGFDQAHPMKTQPARAARRVRIHRAPLIRTNGEQIGAKTTAHPALRSVPSPMSPPKEQ